MKVLLEIFIQEKVDFALHIYKNGENIYTYS